MFICFEGIDGAGKSTHLAYFTEQLRKKKIEVITTREPGGTSTGEQLRVLLLHHDLSVESQIMLAFAARQVHIQQVILPAIKQQKWVITDRFLDSTYAYQGYGKDGDFNLITKLHELTCHNLYPNFTIILDIDPIIAQSRRQYRSEIPLDNFEKKSLEFHIKVRNGYLALAKTNQDINRKYFIVNAENSINVIQIQLNKIIEEIYLSVTI